MVENTVYQDALLLLCAVYDENYNVLLYAAELCRKVDIEPSEFESSNNGDLILTDIYMQTMEKALKELSSFTQDDDIKEQIIYLAKYIDIDGNGEKTYYCDCNEVLETLKAFLASLDSKPSLSRGTIWFLEQLENSADFAGAVDLPFAEE